MFENVFYENSHSRSRKDKQLHNLLLLYKNSLSLKPFDILRLKKRRNLISDKILNKPIELKKIGDSLGDTFETWHLQENSQSELNRTQLSSTEPQVTAHESIEEINSSVPKDKVRNFLSAQNTSNSMTKAKFLILIGGLEVLPTERFGKSNVKQINVIKQHINNLKTLLYVYVLRSQWRVAYKVYGVLLRIPNVDVRSLWPIGIEILKNEYSSLGLKEVKLIDEGKFFHWLSTFYFVKSSSVSSSSFHSVSIPVWRNGTKTHTPLYIISFMWDLLIKHDCKHLKDRLEELLLEPPYNADGVFYFLLALCDTFEIFRIKEHHKNNGNDGQGFQFQSRILRNNINLNLKKCRDLQFHYPEGMLNFNHFQVDFSDEEKNLSYWQNNKDRVHINLDSEGRLHVSEETEKREIAALENENWIHDLISSDEYPGDKEPSEIPKSLVFDFEIAQ